MKLSVMDMVLSIWGVADRDLSLFSRLEDNLCSLAMRGRCDTWSCSEASSDAMSSTVTAGHGIVDM